MELDPTAAGRALDFLRVVGNNLVTLHADFLLGFLVGVAGLRRYRRGAWADVGYASFLGGLTFVLFLAIAFLGLRLDMSEWLVVVAGLVGAALAWTTSGAPPIPLRRLARRATSTGVRAISDLVFRARRPRIPDQLPRELRALDAHHR